LFIEIIFNEESMILSNGTGFGTTILQLFSLLSFSNL